MFFLVLNVLVYGTFEVKDSSNFKRHSNNI